MYSLQMNRFGVFREFPVVLNYTMAIKIETHVHGFTSLIMKVTLE